jgi:hypothetical protein
MAEETKEPWLNYLALTTVLLAVCATFATFKGGGHSTRAVMCQTQASDQWAFFQAKSIKSNLYEINRDQIEMQTVGAPAARAQELREKAEDYGKRVAKYEAEKAQIQAKAVDLERQREDAKLHASIFGQAVIYLQIAILLSSIAALLKKKPVYVLGLIVGGVGVVYFLNGFYLFLH